MHTFQLKDSHRLKSEGMKKYIPCKWQTKENRISYTMSDKINFKSKSVTRDKEDH